MGYNSLQEVQSERKILAFTSSPWILSYLERHFGYSTTPKIWFLLPDLQWCEYKNLVWPWLPSLCSLKPSPNPALPILNNLDMWTLFSTLVVLGGIWKNYMSSFQLQLSRLYWRWKLFLPQDQIQFSGFTIDQVLIRFNQDINIS